MYSQDEALEAALQTIKSLDELILHKRRGEFVAIYNRLREEAPSGAESVLNSLNSTRESIEAYLRQPAEEAISHKVDWATVDSRIRDVQRLDTLSVTSEDRFRQCLGQRSLALQCAKWETQKYGDSRLSKAKANLSCLMNRREGHIQEFIENHGFHLHGGLVTRAIQTGNRMLWLEHELEAPAISAVVCLSVSQSRVRNLPIKSLPTLVEKLKNCRWVLSLAKLASNWFEQCILEYDANNQSSAYTDKPTVQRQKRPALDEVQETTQSRKRPALDDVRDPRAGARNNATSSHFTPPNNSGEVTDSRVPDDLLRLEQLATEMNTNSVPDFSWSMGGTRVVNDSRVPDDLLRLEQLATEMNTNSVPDLSWSIDTRVVNDSRAPDDLLRLEQLATEMNTNSVPDLSWSIDTRVVNDSRVPDDLLRLEQLATEMNTNSVLDLSWSMGGTGTLMQSGVPTNVSSLERSF